LHSQTRKEHKQKTEDKLYQPTSGHFEVFLVKID